MATFNACPTSVNDEPYTITGGAEGSTQVYAGGVFSVSWQESDPCGGEEDYNNMSTGCSIHFLGDSDNCFLEPPRKFTISVDDPVGSEGAICEYFVIGTNTLGTTIYYSRYAPAVDGTSCSLQPIDSLSLDVNIGTSPMTITFCPPGSITFGMSLIGAFSGGSTSFTITDIP